MSENIGQLDKKVWKKNEVAAGIGSTEIPPTVCEVCINKVEAKRSSSGNPMLMCEFEIVSPDSVVINDQKVVLAGQKFNKPAMLNPDKDWGINSIITGLQIGGFDFAEMTEDGEPGLDLGNSHCLKNKCFRMRLVSKRQPERDSQGNPYKDENGKDIMGQAQVEGVGGNFNPFSWIVGPGAEISVPPGGDFDAD